MRIRSIDLAVGAEHGLKASLMHSLGQLVVLAGPNGAGKSRILNTIKDVLAVDVYRPELRATYRSLLERHDVALQKGQSPYADSQVELNRKFLAMAEGITFEGPFKEGSVFEFFPKLSTLLDPRERTEAQQKRSHEALKNSGGIGAIEKHALSYIAAIERRWFSATHQDLRPDESYRQTAIEERTRLHELVRSLLGEEIQLDLDQQPRLFGRPIAESRLSEGQSILLQVAVALHAKSSQLDGLVLLLDEPESHLHPTAINQAVKALVDANPTGQLWIATHSVPVLADVPTDSIWYVSDGKASWAGRAPERVLEGLLGGSNGRERVEEFLRLPAQFAGNRFASECLAPATAVLTGPDDPQAAQIRTFLQATLSESNKPLKLIDFGAGHGRLLSALQERWGEQTDLKDVVDYRAFEPLSSEGDVLDRIVSAAYVADAASRVYRRSDDLATIDAGSVDVVVMCNVLHEIPPDEWPSLFGSGGTIATLLAPSGHLLLLEDMDIPHGEKAHRFGFLILDRIHLFKLLDCRETDFGGLQTVSALDGRLKAHAISARLLGKVTRDSTRSALELLRQTALQEITTLRREAPDSRSGRRHALWTQLLANADLGLSTR